MVSRRSKASSCLDSIVCAAPGPSSDSQAHQPCEAVNGCDHIDVLFDRYARLVLGTAYRVLRDPNEAEDVVQDVFLYIYRRQQLFDPSKGSVKSWIVQIALCRALDRRVYLSRRGFYASRTLDSLHIFESATVEKEIETKLKREHLQRAFSELTYMQRRTIEFFYFDELDLRDISEKLSQPLGSVRHYLYRGLQRLRKSSALRDLHVE